MSYLYAFKIYPTMGAFKEFKNSSFIGLTAKYISYPMADPRVSTSLPYILAEAMVNHKKMVHPPCAL